MSDFFKKMADQFSTAVSLSSDQVQFTMYVKIHNIQVIDSCYT